MQAKYVTRPKPRSIAASVLLVVALLSIWSTTQWRNAAQAAQPHAAAPADTAVTSYKNDISRSGTNSHETQLTSTNVNPTSFGKRISYPVDGYVYAQPLFVPNVQLADGTAHNIVFVATEHDSVYAFDADATGTATPLWQTSFINPAQGITTVPTADVQSEDVVPEIGITGTPVIDSSTNRLYVVVKTKENGSYFQRLHALDIATGKDVAGSPVEITAQVPGTSDGSSNGVVPFNALRENQRSGLLLLNGNVYISWASHGDSTPYHGWVIGYNAASLQQVAAFNTSPNSGYSGIWQSGGALAADSQGNIYFSTGNGDFNLNTGGTETGDSILKLSTQNGLSLADYFSPFNQGCLEQFDADLGSGGVLLIPSHNELINAGKEGRLYVLDQNNLGKYTTIDNACDNQNRTDVDQILQETPPQTLAGGMFNTPAYWNGPNGEVIYALGTNDALKAFALSNGRLSATPTSTSPESYNYPGGNPSISWDGTNANSAIVWLITPSASCGTATDHCNPSGTGQALRAFDANNLSHELYDSNQNGGRDALGSYAKFSIPTIANGRTFVGTANSLDIYGLLN